jgi:cysteine synthase B
MIGRFCFVAGSYMSALAHPTQAGPEPDRPADHPLLASVGRTPLLPLRRLGADMPAGVTLSAKVEGFNPTGSVKDRPAAAILRQALLDGELAGGRTLLDSTSGNMGIAYASFGAALGIPVHLAVPANASRVRLASLRALGAELTLTDPLEGSDGARVVAAELAASDPERFYFANQYANPENWGAHLRTTGPEVVEQTQGQLTHFVCGLGTSGTLVGVGRFLRRRSPRVQLIAVQPDGPLHGLEGLKHYPSTPTPPIYDAGLADDTVQVSTEQAYEMTRRLAREEGLLAGISSGAAVQAALEVGHRLAEGHLVVLLPDSGGRYLDEPFWSAKP